MAIEAEIKGQWLREAIELQGDTLKECASKMGLSYPTTVYNHANDVSYMGAKLLAGLAQVYPSINLHYILTGVGLPKLSLGSDFSSLTDDARTAYEANKRIVDHLKAFDDL
ncbi:hypothetical protein GCM10028825_01920 [Spirosoma agri]